MNDSSPNLAYQTPAVPYGCGNYATYTNYANYSSNPGYRNMMAQSPGYPGISQSMGIPQPMGIPQGMQIPAIPSGGPISGMPMSGNVGSDTPGLLPIQESYIENILRLNLGKPVTIYMTFENNKEWNAKVFKGVLEAAGRDHIIISDPNSGMRYLLLMINLDYITFDEEIAYNLQTIQPR